MPVKHLKFSTKIVVQAFCPVSAWLRKPIYHSIMLLTLVSPPTSVAIQILIILLTVMISPHSQQTSPRVTPVSVLYLC